MNGGVRNIKCGQDEHAMKGPQIEVEAQEMQVKYRIEGSLRLRKRD